MAKSKSKSDGLFHWLGRQIGHVKKAVKTDVAPPPKVIYRDDKVEEMDHPSEPGVTLRRTVTDEVVVDPKKQVK